MNWNRHQIITTTVISQFSPLILEDTGRTLLFNGAEDHKVPSTSRALVDGDLFRLAGRVIGHSFIHGGPKFYGLSPLILQLVIGNKEECPTLGLCDCPDLDVADVVSVVSLTLRIIYICSIMPELQIPPNLFSCF